MTETKTNDTEQNIAPIAPVQPQPQIITVAVQHPVPETGNGLAIASMVTGIVAVLTAFFTIGFIAGVVALVLGIIGVKKPKGKGMAIAGICTGSLAIAIGAIVFIIAFMVGFAQGISS